MCDSEQIMALKEKLMGNLLRNADQTENLAGTSQLASAGCSGHLSAGSTQLSLWPPIHNSTRNFINNPRKRIKKTQTKKFGSQDPFLTQKQTTEKFTSSKNTDLSLLPCLLIIAQKNDYIRVTEARRVRCLKPKWVLSAQKFHTITFEAELTSTVNEALRLEVLELSKAAGTILLGLGLRERLLFCSLAISPRVSFRS